MTFYEVLDKLMKENRVTAKELSESQRIGKNQFKYWKDNGNIPNGETLIALANYFNCSVDYLLGRVDMPNNIYSVSGDNNVQVNGDNCATSISTSAVHSTSDTAELVQLIESLPLVKRAEAIIYLNELKNK